MWHAQEDGRGHAQACSGWAIAAGRQDAGAARSGGWRRRCCSTQWKQPLLVIRDGLKAHRNRLMRNDLDGLAGHIQIAVLPPCAPDSNPVQCRRAWLKRHALANYCPAI